EALKCHIWIADPGLDVLDSSIELQFWIVNRAQTTDTFRINKGNFLTLSVDSPEDEVRVKATCFEKAHASSTAHVTQQKQRFLCELAWVSLTEGLHVLHEAQFPFI